MTGGRSSGSGDASWWWLCDSGLWATKDSSRCSVVLAVVSGWFCLVGSAVAVAAGRRAAVTSDGARRRCGCCAMLGLCLRWWLIAETRFQWLEVRRWWRLMRWLMARRGARGGHSVAPDGSSVFEVLLLAYLFIYFWFTDAVLCV